MSYYKKWWRFHLSFPGYCCNIVPERAISFWKMFICNRVRTVASFQTDFQGDWSDGLWLGWWIGSCSVWFSEFGRRKAFHTRRKYHLCRRHFERSNRASLQCNYGKESIIRWQGNNCEEGWSRCNNLPWFIQSANQKCGFLMEGSPEFWWYDRSLCTVYVCPCKKCVAKIWETCRSERDRLCGIIGWCII